MRRRLKASSLPRPTSRDDFETIVMVTAAVTAKATLLSLLAIFAPA